MRWYVDISSITSRGPTSRFCVEADQWQKALQTVRTRRGDEGSFGNFSIELLDDGYRAIDPLTRMRYVVSRAPEDAPLTTGDAAVASAHQEELTKVEGKPASRPSAPAEPSRPRASAPGSRASERGRMARGGSRDGKRAPAIPDDPVPRGASAPPPSKLVGDKTLASGTPLGAEASRVNGASHNEAPRPRPSDVPLVPPKPMQAETAFERMTGGAAVSLPREVPASAELTTEVLPAFKVLSRRSEDPTPASPLTYREMALTVATTTSLRDAEAIARSQFEVIRNAIAGAPKGKFIQLAVFDHEFSGKPSKAPIVTLAFKDWRNPEPDLRFPQRDGPGPASSARPPAGSQPPPAAVPPSPPAPPAPSPSLAAAPSVAAPSTVEAPTVPVLAETVVKTIVPNSLARPSVEPAVEPSPMTVPDPRPVETREAESASPPPPATERQPEPEPTSEPSEVIRPAPIIAVVASQPEDDIPVSSEAPSNGAPVASASDEGWTAAPSPASDTGSKPAPAPVEAAPPPPPAEEPTPPTVPSEPPPAPTSAQIRARAQEMAGDEEKTLVKPSTPPPAPAPAPAPVAQAEARPASVPPPPNEHVVHKTTKMAAVQHPSAPPPAPQQQASVHPSAPPPPQQHVSVHPSAPPPAQFPSTPPAARPASIPPAPAVPVIPQGPPLLIRQPIGDRRSGDDLISDLFEACSDLNFLNDTLEGAEFVLALVLDSIPSAVALCSFFDINTRELVVVRQAVSPAFTALPNAIATRASEFTPQIARTMRSGRSLVVPAAESGIFSEDPRWRTLGVTPKSAITTAVVAGGRYLGMIEVADPLDGAPFTESDGHALTYIGGQFSEYLAQREIDVTSERILRPKLKELARRN